MNPCEFCGHDHQAKDHFTCNCDYEPCSLCNFDHDYEFEEARRWHDLHLGEGYEDVVFGTPGGFAR